MNITADEKFTIGSAFPHLTELLYEGESAAYTRSFVSVFDHWLLDDEVSQIYPTDRVEIAARQNKFKNLVTHIHKVTPIYTARFRRGRKDKLSIKRVVSERALQNKCKFHLTNELYGDVFKFLIPELSVIYTQYHDWTHMVDFIDSNNVQEFRSLVEHFELNWLKV